MAARATRKLSSESLLIGVLRDKDSGEGLAGYSIAAIASGGRQAPLGHTMSNVDGAFRLAFTARDAARGARGTFELHVANRMGVVLHVEKRIRGGTACDPLVIEIEPRPVLDRPPGPTSLDGFAALAEAYKEEFQQLGDAGIRDKAALLSADARTLALQARVPLKRIEAIRLHVELAHAAQFSGAVASALVEAGIRTRAQLAGARPSALVKALEGRGVRTRLEKEGKLPTNSAIFGWIGYAKGFDPTPFSSPIDIRATLRDAKKVTDRISKLNPHVTVTDISGLLNPFARLQAMARVRGLMEAAGVHDLSSLGTFTVHGQRVIHPGYYVAHRKFDFLGVFASTKYFQATIKQNAGFQHLKSAVALQDAVHFIPNPVTDAVIIGSLVDFIENGKLIIGKDVTSLVIITEEILFSQLNEIQYEGADQRPLPRAPMVPNRAAIGQPNNDRNVYSPGNGDAGRDGGPGSPGATGAAGFDGDTIGPAPKVEIYVQRTPQGLPAIKLAGRRGGTGQPGQHGGHGSDGARGREASSGACRCWRSVGRGGNGGPGGAGGLRGIGGAGGTGGTLTIGTLTQNIAALTTLRPLFVYLEGGPGGNGGAIGLGGAGGRGGSPGDDAWPWCEEEPSRVGTDGAPGPDGPTGVDGETHRDGPQGASGNFALQPITLSDWNALFNRPWIVRLEPWEGLGGASVRVVARNLTNDVQVVFDGSDIAPSGLDVVAGTLDFVIPGNAQGGLRSVQLRLMGATGLLFSNTVSWRVLPQLTGLAPMGGVPGSQITLTGSGFAPGAQVRFGGITLPATSVTGTTIRFRLPDHENIGLPAGAMPVQVVNPDGRASEILTFALTLDIAVRIKAWRVFPDIWVGGGGGFGGPGPGRDEDDVRDIFEQSNTAGAVWAGHRIALQFDTNVGVAAVPADWAESWPIDDITKSDNEDILKATRADGAFQHFTDGAVNFYFVSDIDDWTTHAYTYRGSSASRQEFVIYEDTPLLTDWEEAHVAAHELGHVFSLPHVCDDDSTGTTFGRTCDEENDKDFLMYPSTNFWTDEGNTITVAEAIAARHAATLWHGL